MVKSFLEWHADMEADAGHTYLTLTKKGLTVRHLLEFQTAMIAQNDIPGVIKMEVKEFDSNVKLCYHLNGLISLANYLKRQRVSKSEFSGILDNIIAVLLRCGNYLLNDNSFILREDFIYLHPKSKQISLVYLPVETENNTVPEFKSFLINLLINTANIDTKDNYVQLLLNLTKSEHFGLVEFREQLRSITRNGYIGSDEQYLTGYNQDLSDLTRSAGSNHRPAEGEGEVEGEGEGEGRHNPAQLPDGGLVKPKVRRAAFGILAAVSVAGAVISTVPLEYRTLFAWPDKATARFFGLSLAVLLVIMAVLFLVKKNNALLAARQIRSDEPPVRTGSPWLIKSHLSSAADNAEPGEDIVTGPEEAGDETTFLDNTSMETFLLTGSMHPCLKPVSGEEVIVINKNDFRVGRQKGLTDYVIPSKNIGRIHVEINCIDNKYYITDMDSTNGTFLNGSRLLSNKQYLLQHNDKVMLANLEYLFICS